MTSRRPNLLFVMTDEQKASAMGLYGNPLVPTPSLDRLARGGLTFDRAIAPYPLCVPSRASLVTGRPAREHGIWTNHVRLDPSVPHLFEILRQDGYHLGLFGKNHCLPDDELPSVFHHVVEAHHIGIQGPVPAEVAEVNRWLDRPELLWAPWGGEVNPFAAEWCPTALLTDAALDFLTDARERREPFCMWLSYPDPHTPLQAPASYAEAIPAERIPLPALEADDLESKPLRQRIARHMFASEEVPEDRVRWCISLYYAMERFLDDQIGRVLDHLERIGLADDTLVVFTSDHGTYLGEHGMVRKSMAFYDCLLHVPLVLRWPGRIPSGRRVPHPVSLLELLPTVLDLLGRPRPRGIEGPGLLAAAEEPAGAVVVEAGVPGSVPPGWDDLKDVPEHPLDGRFFPWAGRAEAWWGPARMVRTAAAKLVRYDTGEAEVYDLAADPGELSSLAGTAAGRDLAAELEPLLGDG